MQVEENIPLAPFTTLRIGGPARYLVRVENESQLVEAVAFARGRGLPIFVLGGGSNLVVSDRGFDGVVLHMAIGSLTSVEYGADFGASVDQTVPAGMDWDAFVLAACRGGLSGVECLAGIPGLVGGTPVQNVGAYGQEVSETIVSVRVFDLERMQFVSLSRSECGFGYRRSIFNSTARGRYIVTAVTFHFEVGRAVELKYAELQRRFAQRHLAGERPSPLEVYEAVRTIRHGKGMLLVEGEPDCRSAGSFFKNPVVDDAVFAAILAALGLEARSVPHWPAGEGRVKLAAAWLLEEAGFHRTYAMGQAGISSRHTLALVNRGGATAAEILTLRDEIRRVVADRFGIELEQEPVMLGD